MPPPENVIVDTRPCTRQSHWGAWSSCDCETGEQKRRLTWMCKSETQSTIDCERYTNYEEKRSCTTLACTFELDKDVTCHTVAVDGPVSGSDNTIARGMTFSTDRFKLAFDLFIATPTETNNNETPYAKRIILHVTEDGS